MLNATRATGGGKLEVCVITSPFLLLQGAADMSPLRNKMIRELELHRKAPGTVKQYVAAVAQLARHYRRSPDSISIEEVRDFIHHLITQRKIAFSTCNVRLAGIRFFFQQVLRRDEFPLRVPAKRSGRLPEPLSRSEISRLFDATTNP